MAEKKSNKEPLPMMIVGTALKKFIKGEAEVNISSDFADAANEQLASILKCAVERCQANGRKTLRPADL